MKARVHEKSGECPEVPERQAAPGRQDIKPRRGSEWREEKQLGYVVNGLEYGSNVKRRHPPPRLLRMARDKLNSMLDFSETFYNTKSLRPPSKVDISLSIQPEKFCICQG